MILKAPGVLVQYFRRLRVHQHAPRRVVRALPALVTAICLCTRKRTQTELGAFVIDERRDKATVGRILDDDRFRSRDLHKAAVEQAITARLPDRDDPQTWLVAFDGTGTQRGGFTKILGANQYRLKDTSAKGRSTKAHTFLMGVLITHTGFRIPLPRHTCFPKKFVRPGENARKRLTQVDLAGLMIKDLQRVIPDHVRLVVVADEAFEGKKLFRFAKPGRLVIIAPVNSDRCFANARTPTKSNGRRIQSRGLNLSLKTFTLVRLDRGSEKTVHYRRYGARKPSPNDYRIYKVRHEERVVAGLGNTGVVYSWKSPVYEPRTDFGQQRFKALVCSDPSWSGAEIAEWFEMRWTAIEILFRELKQELGLGDYVGQSLEAFERHVDLVLLSLLALEHYRDDILTTEEADRRTKDRARVARTKGMVELLRQECDRELWDIVSAAIAGGRRAKRDLERFFMAVMGNSRGALVPP